MKPCLAIVLTVLLSSIIPVTVYPKSVLPPAMKQKGRATYFTYAGCRHEGTSGICASGKRLNDSAMWCALPAWKVKAGNLKFGQRIRVTNTHTKATCIVSLMDLGPGRKSQRAGTVIDLTLRAYKVLGGSLKRGHIHVTWKLST